MAVLSISFTDTLPLVMEVADSGLFEDARLVLETGGGGADLTGAAREAACCFCNKRSTFLKILELFFPI